MAEEAGDKPYGIRGVMSALRFIGRSSLKGPGMLESQSFSYSDTDLRPVDETLCYVVEFLTELLESREPPEHWVVERGIDEEGIYRQSGRSGAISAFCSEILTLDTVAISGDGGKEALLRVVCNDNLSPVEVAASLKQLLRLHFEPLLSYELYPTFLEVRDPAMLADALKRLKHQRQVNHAVLKRLVSHLEAVAAAPENRMSADGLAICVGPNLLRGAEEAETPDLRQAADETKASRFLVNTLISHSQILFGRAIITPSTPPSIPLPPSFRRPSASKLGEDQKEGPAEAPSPSATETPAEPDSEPGSEPAPKPAPESTGEPVDPPRGSRTEMVLTLRFPKRKAEREGKALPELDRIRQGCETFGHVDAIAPLGDRRSVVVVAFADAAAGWALYEQWQKGLLEFGGVSPKIVSAEDFAAIPDDDERSLTSERTESFEDQKDGACEVPAEKAEEEEKASLASGKQGSPALPRRSPPPFRRQQAEASQAARTLRTAPAAAPAEAEAQGERGGTEGVRVISVLREPKYGSPPALRKNTAPRASQRRVMFKLTEEEERAEEAKERQVIPPAPERTNNAKLAEDLRAAHAKIADLEEELSAAQSLTLTVSRGRDALSQKLRRSERDAADLRHSLKAKPRAAMEPAAQAAEAEAAFQNVVRELNRYKAKTVALERRLEAKGAPVLPPPPADGLSLEELTQVLTRERESNASLMTELRAKEAARADLEREMRRLMAYHDEYLQGTDSWRQFREASFGGVVLDFPAAPAGLPPSNPVTPPRPSPAVAVAAAATPGPTPAPTPAPAPAPASSRALPPPKAEPEIASPPSRSQACRRSISRGKGELERRGSVKLATLSLRRTLNGARKESFEGFGEERRSRTAERKTISSKEILEFAAQSQEALSVRLQGQQRLTEDTMAGLRGSLRSPAFVKQTHTSYLNPYFAPGSSPKSAKRRASLQEGTQERAPATRRPSATEFTL